MTPDDDNERCRNVGRITLDPPEPALDAEALAALIDRWLADCAARLDAQTAAGYGFKLNYFVQWWSTTGPGQGWRLCRRDLTAFEVWLRSVPGRRVAVLSYHSRNDVLRRLRSLFAWAAANGYTDRDYSGWVPSPHGEPPSRTAADLDALSRLFAAASTSPYPARDRTILAVLIGTGIRRAECASMCVEDVRIYADGSGTAVVTGKRTRANKSGRRSVAFDAVTGSYLRAYLDASGYQEGALFRSNRGPLTAQGIYKTVKRAIRAAGLTDLVGPHDLRRAFATHYARLNKGQTHSDLLRRQMGHASYRMTSVYTLLDADDIREELQSPLHWIRREGADG